MLRFAESMPVVAKHVYVGFGQDDADVTLDLGVAFYQCHSLSKVAGKQDCAYAGMLNWETEGNHPHVSYEKAWPQSPMPTPRKKERRKQRCTDAHNMCDGLKAFSGLLFKEKEKEVAEYSGEVLGAGGDGDDTFLFLDLEGLKSLGITHAVLTGHVFTGQKLSDLNGAFFRIAAGEVFPGQEKGLMDTILYQDLDEALEPPTPDRHAGHQARSNAMMLGMFNIRGDDDWVFGEKPGALSDGSHWEFTMLNQPIKGRSLSKSHEEVRDVLLHQLVPIMKEEQVKVNQVAGKENLVDYEDDDLDKEFSADTLFEAMPGGLPGSSTRNYYVLPEEVTYQITVQNVFGPMLDKFDKQSVYVSHYWNGVKLVSTKTSIVEATGGIFKAGGFFIFKATPSIGKATLGGFPLSLNVWVSNWGKNTKVATLVAAPHTLHPGIFTGNPFPFEQVVTLTVGDPTQPGYPSNVGLSAEVRVQIVSEEW